MNDAGINSKYCPGWRDSKFIGPLKMLSQLHGAQRLETCEEINVHTVHTPRSAVNGWLSTLPWSCIWVLGPTLVYPTERTCVPTIQKAGLDVMVNRKFNAPAKNQIRVTQTTACHTLVQLLY
jgi:hypothetical protein